jgi:hypothetical protein
MNIRLICLTLLTTIAASAQAEEFNWPQELTADNGNIVIIYQPQVETFSGNNLEARAAVSVKSPATDNAPVFGAIWFKARLDTDRESRTALIRDIEVVDIRFADATDAQKQQLAGFIETEIEGAGFTISIDHLLADLDGNDVDAATTNLKHEPPTIMLSREPALLVSIDGDPVFETLENTNYERVVNTPFLLARGGIEYYLYIGSNAWYESRAIAGPWARAQRIPEELGSLVEPADDDDANVDDVHIIVASEPTELIVSDGDPSWSPVEGMDLLYMDNSDSNAFLELSTQKYYVLLSGRWYRSEGVLGNLQWEHVPNDELPEPFGDIPEDSVNADVLAQVAGTAQAREAVLDNTIPQTAAINRDDASFSVEYDGTPEFAPIEDIKVEYAQNTSDAVFRYGNLYYACDDGVWYVANSATGPWTVATEIPDAIYKIPASNPHHNVTYVRVYDVTPQVVYVGYTPGYYGSYYYSGSIVYGTGWYYNPWYGPHYYPRYPTWGFHVHYNPWYGWGFGVSWTNGPFRFTYSRHGAWWGVGGYRPYPRPYVHGGYRKTNINVNINNNINIGGGGRPQARPNLYNRPENLARKADRPATPSTRQARPATGIQNNVLTDRTGNVYQRDPNGSWERRENGQWTRPQDLDGVSRPQPATRPSQPTTRPAQPTTRPAQPATRPSQPATRPSQPRTRPSQPAVRPQLERDYNARQHGANRSQNYQQRAAPRRRR